MTDITLSAAVRSNLLSLQNTAELLGKTQERLATGLKVNSALDNPTNFFTASALNSRANDLGRLQDSISNANQTLEAADNGLTAITALVESAQATARQALQTAVTVEETTAATAGTLAGSGFTALDLSTASSAATAGTVAGGSFSAVDFTNGGANNGQISFSLDVDGAGAQTITVAYADVNGTAASNSAVTAAELVGILNDKINTAFSTTGVNYASVNGSGGIDITSNTTGTSSSIAISSFAATNGATGSGLANGTNTGSAAVAGDSITFDLTVGSTTQSISLNSTITASDNSAVTAAEAVTAINSQFGSNVASVVDGEISITDPATGASSVVTIASFTANGAATTSGLANATDSGTAAVTNNVANPKRDEFVATYNDLLGQIDALAKDAGFNGVNLLNGASLTVLFNEDGSSKLDITGVTYDSAGLNLSAVATGGFNANADIDTTLDSLAAAMADLRSQASSFGSNLSVVEIRENFTKSTINTLETGAANLTLADTNEEAANLLALQTRQQLSSTALSLASSADQQVLRLF